MNTGVPVRSARRAPPRIPVSIALCLFLMLVFASIVTFLPRTSFAYSPSILATQTFARGEGGNAPAVPGQPIVDQYTVALYHFDAPTGTNQVIDETGHYTGTLHGNAAVTTAGLYSGVLALDGSGSYMDIGHLGAMPQGTIELFVDFTYACNSTGDPGLVVAGSQYGGTNIALELTQGTLFDIYTNGTMNRADSGINPCRYLRGSAANYFLYAGYAPWPYETFRFHHVAATWGPRGIEVWVDGVLHGVGRGEPPPGNVYSYSCNPQMYAFIQPGPYAPVTVNPLYPDRCLEPAPAPLWTPGYPPGDYTGPLPAYETFLVGCKPNGICFRGRIDELRISNIQRTFHYSVVPTITPTPTATSVAITGEYSVDATMQALYHLNDWAVPCQFWSCVRDSVTNQAHAASGALHPLGRFNKALATANGTLVIDNPNLRHFDKGSVEAWVNFQGGAGRQPIIFAGATPGDWGGALHLGALNSNASIFFSIYDGIDSRSALSSKTPQSLKGCWHHIAGTWGPRGIELWIDGQLENRNTTYTGAMGTQVLGWRFGGNYANESMSGGLDEVLVTAAQRTYTAAHYAVNRSVRAPTDSESLLYLPWLGKDATSGSPTSNLCW